MANSLIEDVLKEPINESGNDKEKNKKNNGQKKSKKIIIAFIIIIIIIIILAIGAMYYLQNATTEISDKAAFFKYVSSNNLESVTDFTSYETYIERLLSENSVSEASIAISYESDDFSISNIELNLNTENDIENKKEYVDAVLSYSDNDLFEFEILTSSDAIALKSDEVVTAYVAIPYEYIYSEYLNDELSDTVSIFDTVGISNVTVVTDDESDDTDEENIIDDDSEDTTGAEDEDNEIEASTTDTDSEISLEKIIEIIENMGSISEASLELYEDIIDENLDETHFAKSNVTTIVGLSSGSYDVTGYTLTMTETEFANIVKECLETLETDTDTIDLFSDLFDIIGIDEEDFVSGIDELIYDIEDEEYSDENIIEISVYESDGQTVEIIVNLIEEATTIETIEIEFVYGSNENSTIATIVDGENTGFSFEITNVVSDLSSEIDIEISYIEEGEIQGTFTASMNLVSSNDLYTMESRFTINMSDSDADDTELFYTTIDTEVDFSEEPNVEDLTDENSVSIEDLSDEQLEAISKQLDNVLNSKLSELSFIDTNTNTTTIEQSDSETDEEDETKKEEAKNDLIAAVQEKMIEAEENGEEYTIEDLLDLEIDDLGEGNYESFGVVISSDIATITIDGEYIFYIDSDFNLTD